jgi:site-specific DNA-methyltransferase (adenine-specific)
MAVIPAVEVAGARVFLGDCRDVLRGLPDNSVDSIVTDPPYELNFMSKKWDNTGIAYDVTVWLECLRVLKPGGHVLAFGGSRTYHRLGVAIEDAGFEIRDTIAWISSKTFPKSLNVEKAMDKAGMDGSVASGWGTGLKQVVEPVVLARKPLDGTVADNFQVWGVGGLNIDATRIDNLSEAEKNWTPQRQHADNPMKIGGAKPGDEIAMYKPGGRWPANVILDEVSAGLLDEQTADFKGATSRTHRPNRSPFTTGTEEPVSHQVYADSGGASRFFYVAKASRRDRNEGLEELEAIRHADRAKDDGVGGKNPRNRTNQAKQNFHPTVKPTQLMRYLIKLVTPEGGVVLDPFTGSGSTGKAALLDGYQFIGAELTEEYLPIIEGRLRWASEQVEGEDVTLF